MDKIDQRLLNEFQREFPLTSTPYRDIAEKLDITEQQVIDRLTTLQDNGAVSRVGAVFRPKRIGVSTLAAMSVPDCRLNDVANLVSGYDEVNHNYEREHQYNLWFVVVTRDQTAMDTLIADIEQRTGIKVSRLPMIEDYYIDLGFNLKFDVSEETNERNQ